MKRFISKTFLVLSLWVVAGAFGPSQILAGGYEAGCVPVYGGGVECPKPAELVIDKTVRNPATGIFVDNLTPSDPRYKPQGIVTFRIIVKNTGGETIPKITVTDKLPQFVDFMSGPGSFNAQTRTLTFDIHNLGGGVSQQYDVKARVVHPAVLPAEKNIVCPVNIVEASFNGRIDKDESQFCIEKEMVVPTVPKAGPENWILALLGTSLTVGLYLRRKAII